MKKKINYNKGSYTILTTSADGFEYEDYLEFCEANGIEPYDEDSDHFFEWCQEESNFNFEADMDNIHSCKQYNVPVLVTGSLGLWDGRHEITAKVFPTVYDAIQAMLGRDIRDIEAKFEDGAINVWAYHHDGCNSFTINALSAKGQRKAQYNFNGNYINNTVKEDVKRLPYLYAI